MKKKDLYNAVYKRQKEVIEFMKAYAENFTDYYCEIETRLLSALLGTVKGIDTYTKAEIEKDIKAAQKNEEAFVTYHIF